MKEVATMQIELNDNTILEVADDPTDLGSFNGFLVENNTSMIPHITGRAAYIIGVDRGLNPMVTYIELHSDGVPDLDRGDRMSLVLDEDVVIVRIS